MPNCNVSITPKISSKNDCACFYAAVCWCQNPSSRLCRLTKGNTSIALPKLFPVLKVCRILIKFCIKLWGLIQNENALTFPQHDSICNDKFRHRKIAVSIILVVLFIFNRSCFSFLFFIINCVELYYVVSNEWWCVDQTKRFDDFLNEYRRFIVRNQSWYSDMNNMSAYSERKLRAHMTLAFALGGGINCFTGGLVRGRTHKLLYVFPYNREVCIYFETYMQCRHAIIYWSK